MAYPATLDSFSTKVDGVTDVLAADINNLQTAVVAIETALGTNLANAHDAAQLTGDVASARLGTGVADSSKFLRGDKTWQVVSTTPTTAQVTNAYKDASALAVGSLAILSYASGGADVVAGTAYAGNLYHAYLSAYSGFGAAIGAAGMSSAVGGTWRAMNSSSQDPGATSDYPIALFLRVA